jgi:hypothetical protein
MTDYIHLASKREEHQRRTGLTRCACRKSNSHVVGRVRSQQMAKMPLAEHDNVVKTFPPDRTDRPFTISVLPRRSRRGWPIPNAHRPKAADEDVTVDGVAVTNDVSRRYFPTATPTCGTGMHPMLLIMLDLVKGETERHRSKWPLSIRSPHRRAIGSSWRQ